MFPPSNQANKQRITILNSFDPSNPVDDSSKQRSPKQVQFVDPKVMPKESRLQWKTSTPTENNQLLTQMNHQSQFQREAPIKQAEFQDHGVILEENEEDSSQQNTSHNENYIEDQQNQEIKDSDQTEPVKQLNFEHNNFEYPARNLVLTNQLEFPGNNQAHVGIQQGHPLSAIKQSIRSRLEELETRIVEEGQSNSNLRKQINQMDDAITETASELDDFSHYSRSAKATSTKQTPRMLGEKDEYNFVSGSKSQKRISEQLSIGNSADKEIAEARENNYNNNNNNNNNTERLNGIIPNSFSFRLREKQQEEDQFKKYYEEANKKINEFSRNSGAQRDGEQQQQQLTRTSLLPSPKSPENTDFGRYQKPQNNNNQDKQQNVRLSTKRSNVNNRNELHLQESQSFSRDKGFANSIDLKHYLDEDLNRSKEQQNQLFSIRNSIKQGLKMLKESIPVNDENKAQVVKPNIETIQQIDHKSTLQEYILRQETDKSKQQEQDETQEQIKQLQQKLQKYEQHLFPNQDQSEGEQLLITKQNDFRSKTTANGSDFSENEKNKRSDRELIGKNSLNQEKKGIACGRLQVKSIKDYSAAEEAEQEMRKIEKEGEEYQKQLQQRKKEIEGKEAEARLQRTIADCIRVYTEQRNDKLAQTRKEQDKQEITCSPTRIQSYLLNPPRQQQTSKIREIISRKVHSWLNQSVDNLVPKNSRIQIKQHQHKSMKAS